MLDSALILAGGLGTRLRPAVPELPKALAPIAGRPFVGYLLEYLASQGIRRVALCTGYMHAAVVEAIGMRYAGIDVVYSREESPLGTAGAVRRALPLVQTGLALVLNGDSFCEVDLAAMSERHRASRASATLLLTRQARGRAFGSVDIGPVGEVIRFGEKVGEEAQFINAGVYLLARGVIEAIDPHAASSLERDVFPALVGSGLFGFPGEGRFIDIGTPETYGRAHSFLDSVGLASSRWALLDRDGTILVHHDHLSDPELVELIPGASTALRALRAMGLRVAIVTNQSVIGRGWLDEPGLSRIHRRMLDLFEAEGAHVDAIVHCPHRPEDGCVCRKPEPGLLTQLAAAFPVSLSRSFVVGDDAKDMNLGRQVGATTILVRTGLGRATEARADSVPNEVVDDLVAATEAIQRRLRAERA
jgi:histidinol-phosphate phosphatase family protein